MTVSIHELAEDLPDLLDGIEVAWVAPDLVGSRRAIHGRFDDLE